MDGEKAGEGCEFNEVLRRLALLVAERRSSSQNTRVREQRREEKMTSERGRGD